MPYTTDEIRQKYESIASRYDLLSVPEKFFGVDRLRRRLLSRAKGDVLEVAAGTGKNFQYYPPGIQLTVTDISSAMLDVAKRRARKLDLSVLFIEMNAERLNFPDHYFDTVVSTLTTCTFPNPERALQEFSRVCRPTGRILLLEHGKSTVGFLGRWQDRRAERHAQTAGCYWNREPLEIVHRAGLKVIRNARHFLGVFHLIEAAPIAN